MATFSLTRLGSPLWSSNRQRLKVIPAKLEHYQSVLFTFTDHDDLCFIYHKPISENNSDSIH